MTKNRTENRSLVSFIIKKNTSEKEVYIQNSNEADHEKKAHSTPERRKFSTKRHFLVIRFLQCTDVI